MATPTPAPEATAPGHRVGLLRRVHRGLVRRLGYVWGPRLMSSLRKRWVLLRHPHATIRFGRYVHLAPGFSLHIPEHGTFIVGDAVEFRRGFRAEVVGDGRIEIGPGCVFSYYSLIQCGTTIEIGTRCMFGQSTMIVDGNHRFRDLSKTMAQQGYDYRPIRIEDDAVVTTKCTIINHIGTRAFIGANSVVTNPIPPFTVAAGVPARVIEDFGPDADQGE